MEFDSTIDPALFADALHTQIALERENRKSSRPEVIETGDSRATVLIYVGDMTRKRLLADITWVPRDGGCHVTVSYRTECDDAEDAPETIAPLAARLTVALLGGALTWGVALGISRLIAGSDPVFWLYSIPAPVLVWAYLGFRWGSAKIRAKCRLERLLGSFEK